MPADCPTPSATEATPKFRKVAKISWYRCQVDPKLMSELMKCSDYHGFKQALGHLGLWCVTGTLAYLAFSHITGANWLWSVPLLLVAMFAHGHILRILTACWLGLPPEDGKMFVLGTGAISTLGHEHEAHAIMRWNA